MPCSRPILWLFYVRNDIHIFGSQSNFSRELLSHSIMIIWFWEKNRLQAILSIFLFRFTLNLNLCLLNFSADATEVFNRKLNEFEEKSNSNRKRKMPLMLQSLQSVREFVRTSMAFISERKERRPSLNFLWFVFLIYIFRKSSFDASINSLSLKQRNIFSLHWRGNA